MEPEPKEPVDPPEPSEPDTRSSDFAALWSSDGVTRSFAPSPTGVPADLPFLFSAGQRFGPYLIVRPIGKGGMGQVYEAEEIDSGRRVAVKILSRGIGDDEERERFLQEGRLAASLSHPNTVYVFGTTEVQGFPVIAMELVPSGTLKDLVVPGEPMPIARAVDAILQVLDGLEAAASLGILHRDIKPSNCFIHRDGRVLVGDFGLSVGASGNQNTTGTILGTPGFASPEQLRGASLDVRSDIYSVGATLFYLLAGRAPFDDRDTTSLMKRVASEPPPLLTALRSDLPRGVAAIVARCLAKAPAERFDDYAALRDALQPYGFARLAPAPIVRRTVAGLIDAWVAGLLILPFGALLQMWPVFGHRGDAYLLGAIRIVITILFFGFVEGRWGAGPGKALLGLRLVDAHHVAPGMWRATARAAVFCLPGQIVKAFANDSAETMTNLVWVLVMFSVGRKKNGFTALHDRWTGTRVVRRRARAEARARVTRVAAGAETEFKGAGRIGPYLVPQPASLDRTTPVRIVGFDDRLHRRVWIDLLPPGTPVLPAWRRDLGRPARLRWLAGRRDGDECWDAYEAVDGAPFSSLVGTAQPWSRVRHWLFDLTRETAAALDEGLLPPLTGDRVWIGSDGHARILERPAPGHTDASAAGMTIAGIAEAQKFLFAIATAALTGGTHERAAEMMPDMPLPLRARTFLLSLRGAAFESPAALLHGLEDAAETPAAVSKATRGVHVALLGAFPLGCAVIAIGAILLVNARKTDFSERLKLDALLDELRSADKSLAKHPDVQVQRKRDDIEIYLAEHMVRVIDDPGTWEDKTVKIGFAGARERARAAVERHPVRSAEEVRGADLTAAPLLEDEGNKLGKLANVRGLTAIFLATVGGTFIAVGVFAAIGALVTGSGFTFRMFGMALVNRRGRKISRVRALWRAAVTWSPIFAVAVALKRGPDITKAGPSVIALQFALLGVLAAAAVWAWLHPSRGIQDRLAGSWIVPR